MTTLKTVIVTLIVAAAVVVAGIVAYIYSGAYAIGADKPDGSVIHWAMHTTMMRSVASSAAGIEPPKNLNSPALIQMGAMHYKEMCVSCHLAPGVESSELREGLNPKPPELAKVANTLSSTKIFWVIKHGVKMTAMPAWGESHDDMAIRAMTAFIKYRLPTMTAAEFDKVVPEEEGDEEHAHGHPAPSPSSPGEGANEHHC